MMADIAFEVSEAMSLEQTPCTLYLTSIHQMKSDLDAGRIDFWRINGKYTRLARIWIRRTLTLGIQARAPRKTIPIWTMRLSLRWKMTITRTMTPITRTMTRLPDDDEIDALMGSRRPR
jgi:hypothetical protein